VSASHLPPLASYPTTRLRRNRRDPWSRKLVAENVLSAADLIWPVFVHDEEGRAPVPSMPEVYRMSLSALVDAAGEAAALGIPTIAVFPAIETALKDPDGHEAVNPDNLVCRAVAAVKKALPELGVLCDVALDPFTSHGHDGVIRDGYVANDETVAILQRQAVIQAKAGCDIIAPSAVGSATALGSADKRTYQMDPANGDEALREVALDIAEGADMVMVKPGLPYLDVLRRVKDAFRMPTFAYQVSGEYSMIHAAAERGWLDGERAMMESLLCFKRAGADGILSYFAVDAAKRLKAG
jgi:porphobilinogen synthase